MAGIGEILYKGVYTGEHDQLRRMHDAVMQAHRRRQRTVACFEGPLLVVTHSFSTDTHDIFYISKTDVRLKRSLEGNILSDDVLMQPTHLILGRYEGQRYFSLFGNYRFESITLPPRLVSNGEQQKALTPYEIDSRLVLLPFVRNPRALKVIKNQLDEEVRAQQKEEWLIETPKYDYVRVASHSPVYLARAQQIVKKTAKKPLDPLHQRQREPHVSGKKHVQSGDDGNGKGDINPAITEEKELEATVARLLSRITLSEPM